MIKFVCPSMTERGYMPQLQAQYWEGVSDEFYLTNCFPEVNGEPSWALSWAFPLRKTHNAVFETGFFADAGHIDRLGLYERSSLNTTEGVSKIKEFSAPERAADLMQRNNYGSKYRQVGIPVKWDGPVLGAQIGYDLSIRSVGEKELYWEFIEAACKYYGKHLFIKLHPRGPVENRLKHEEIANRYKVKHGVCDLSVLNTCSFLLVYCSTLAMDAFIRGTPVAQYAPGYWHKTGAVTYTDWSLPDDVEDTVEMGHKLADWCAWKYCFNYSMPREMWFNLLRLYADSEDLFPITDEFCYATNYHWRQTDA